MGWEGGPWWGWDAPYYPAPAPTKQEEMTSLKQEAEYLKQTLSDIQKRMDELETGAAGKDQ
jgi:hypothetical protein